jgi:hypothetical protein
VRLHACARTRSSRAHSRSFLQANISKPPVSICHFTYAPGPRLRASTSSQALLRPSGAIASGIKTIAGTEGAGRSRLGDRTGAARDACWQRQSDQAAMNSRSECQRSGCGRTLERRLGARLFERGRFGVRPTELGRTVYPAAKRALEALGSVAELVELSRAQGSVDLRLSASHTIGEFLLPGWLADFRREQPCSSARPSPETSSTAAPSSLPPRLRRPAPSMADELCSITR